MFFACGVPQNGMPLFSAHAFSDRRLYESGIGAIGYGSDRRSSGSGPGFAGHAQDGARPRSNDVSSSVHVSGQSIARP